MYDWNDLRYFLELSRQGKLVRAAARLHVDHTTVSRRITTLEKQLDVRLFDKSPNGYKLTDAGLRLLPLAEQIETLTAHVRSEFDSQWMWKRGQDLAKWRWDERALEADSFEVIRVLLVEKRTNQTCSLVAAEEEWPSRRWGKSGVNPALSRICDRGRTLHEATGCPFGPLGRRKK